MRPFESEAAYVNYLDADEQDRTRAVYGGRYERLAALKKKYDPTNFFRLNQNIKPAG
jgi:berberine-like enzyme